MKVMLLNAGSSSLKGTLAPLDGGHIFASMLADWAGAVTRYCFTGPDHREHRCETDERGHASAVRRFMDDLIRIQPAALADLTQLAAIGHRVVHGGPFTSSVAVTPALCEELSGLTALAPLHNPPSLETLAAAQAILPEVAHIAVFDTAFHATLPPHAFTYPVPQQWTRDWGLRKYGFHGLSHAYCARRAEELLSSRQNDPHSESSRLVICHLGHGCSASAVQGGRCVDTTMGLTPLEGLMMATRSGSVDPGLLLHLQQQRGLTAAELDRVLNRESGLLGVSGVSADMREVQAAAQAGHASAQLALDIYAHRIRQVIGAFAVTMGGLDALVFTAGVGEHSSELRTAVCAGLECLGLKLDLDANSRVRPDADIATQDSKGRIYVIHTREDVTMLDEVRRVLSQSCTVDRTGHRARGDRLSQE